MQNITAIAELTPAIAERANALVDAVLGLALTNTVLPSKSTFISMRDRAEDAAAAATALVELLEIQTQGGEGPIADGYNPADPAATTAAIRAHILGILASRAA